MTRDPKPLQIAAVVLLALFWAINWPIMKIGLTVVEPWTFRTAVVLIGGAGCLLVARVLGQPLRIPAPDLVPLLWLTLFQGVLWNAFSGFGIAAVEASRAAVLGFTMPVWATLISILFLGERVTARRMIGLALGIAGLMLLLVPVLGNMAGRLGGTISMLAGAVSWAVATVMVKAHDWRMPVLTLCGWQFLLATVPLGIAACLFGDPGSLLRMTPDAGWAMAYSGLVPMVFCQAVWFSIVRRLPTSLASGGTLLVPPLGVLSAAVILGERVGTLDICALVLVLLAMTLVMPGLGWRSRRAPVPTRD